MYEIILSDLAKKQLRKLPHEIRNRIGKVFERIRIRPEAYIKKLVDDQGYSLRVGDYRIILDTDKNKLLILVIKIGHRKKIYK
jgi:mRNA interferase RelE/StbE